MKNCNLVTRLQFFSSITFTISAIRHVALPLASVEYISSIALRIPATASKKHFGPHHRVTEVLLCFCPSRAGFSFSQAANPRYPRCSFFRLLSATADSTAPAISMST